MMTSFVLVLIATVQSQVAKAPHGFGGHVFVVQSGGPIPEIQPAVDAAADGDTILVKSGVYAGFTVQDKGLSIVADSGATLDVQGFVHVDGISPSKTLLLSGLVVHGPASDSPVVSAESVFGHLRIQSCTIVGEAATAGQVGVLLDDVADAAFSESTIRGGTGGRDASHPIDGGTGGASVSAIASTVAVYDCDLSGGDGGSGATGSGQVDGGSGGRGGPAYRLLDGFVFVSGSNLRGGAGGRGADSGPCLSNSGPGNGGAGGSSIQVVSGASPDPIVIVLGNLLTPGSGGAGGTDISGYCYGDGTTGPAGGPITAPPGAVESFSGTSRRLIAPNVARENTFVTLSCFGQSGDSVLILSSPTPEFSFDENLHGVTLLDASRARVIASGTIPAGGSLHLALGIPSMGADSRPLFLQAYFRDSTSLRFVASPITLVELDASY